jgi:hypothetical protein
LAAAYEIKLEEDATNDKLLKATMQINTMKKDVKSSGKHKHLVSERSHGMQRQLAQKLKQKVK